MKTALVVDDHPITHLGCNRLLTDIGYEKILDARSSDEAYRLAVRHQPGLIVLDLGLPGVGGLQMIPYLIDKAPECRILIFSMNDSPVFAARALESGAAGYLSKNSMPEDFVAAVAAVENNRFFLEPRMATELALLNLGRDRNPIAALTSREHQVLRLVGQGKSYGAIAAEINVSYKTVANTCSMIKNKLGAKTLSDLIRAALEHEAG